MAIKLDDLRNAARGAQRVFPGPDAPPNVPVTSHEPSVNAPKTESGSPIVWFFVVGFIILVLVKFPLISQPDPPVAPEPNPSPIQTSPEIPIAPPVYPSDNPNLLEQASLNENLRVATKCFQAQDFSCALRSAREALEWAPRNERANEVISDVRKFFGSLEAEFYEAIRSRDLDRSKNILARYRKLAPENEGLSATAMAEALSHLEALKLEEERSRVEAAAPPEPAEVIAKIEFLPSSDKYYPAASRRLGEEGVVAVKVCMDGVGRLLDDPIVVASSGSNRLDSGAIRLARAGRYRSGSLLGEKSCVTFRVRFQMQ